MHISYIWLCYFHLVSILFSSIGSFSIIVDFTDFVQQISFSVPVCFIFQLSICFGTFEINGKVLFPNTVSNQFRISTCSELIYKWVFGVTIPLKKRYQINSSFWHFSLEHFCDEAKKDLMLPKKKFKRGRRSFPNMYCAICICVCISLLEKSTFTFRYIYILFVWLARFLSIQFFFNFLSLSLPLAVSLLILLQQQYFRIQFFELNRKDRERIMWYRNFACSIIFIWF